MRWVNGKPETVITKPPDVHEKLEETQDAQAHDKVVPILAEITDNVIDDQQGNRGAHRENVKAIPSA